MARSPRTALSWLPALCVVIPTALCFTLYAGDATDPIALRVPLEPPLGSYGHSRFAAPKSGVYADPNRIVYDDAYLNAKLQCRLHIIRCGIAYCAVDTPDGTSQVSCSFTTMDLGTRYHVDDLVRFLSTRRDCPHFERMFPRVSPELLAEYRRARRYDPWTVDLCCVIHIADGIDYPPLMAVVGDLAKSDPDPEIRAEAKYVFGRYEQREARADLQRRMAKQYGTAIAPLCGPMVALTATPVRVRP